MKKCSKCLIVKSVNSFYQDKCKKDNLSAYCKDCMIAKSKFRYKNKRKEILLQCKDYREKNIDRKRVTDCQYRKDNKEKLKKLSSEYYLKVIKGKRRLSKDHFNKYQREYRKARKEKDPNYKIASTCRVRILSAIKAQQTSKKNKTTGLIGCSIPEYVLYIESRFKKGMSWNNHGRHGWHIDHIVPIASFDLTDEKEQKKAFHYSNVQPLWAEDNHKKHAKIL